MCALLKANLPFGFPLSSQWFGGYCEFSASQSTPASSNISQQPFAQGGGWITNAISSIWNVLPHHSLAHGCFCADFPGHWDIWLLGTTLSACPSASWHQHRMMRPLLISLLVSKHHYLVRTNQQWAQIPTDVGALIFVTPKYLSCIAEYCDTAERKENPASGSCFISLTGIAGWIANSTCTKGWCSG